MTFSPPGTDHTDSCEEAIAHVIFLVVSGRSDGLCDDGECYEFNCNEQL